MIVNFPYTTYTERRNLPSMSGVYIVADGDTVLYVGQSRNIHKRWIAHHRSTQMRRHYRIYWQIIPIDELNRAEENLIDQFCPTWNSEPVESINVIHFQPVMGTRQQVRDLIRAADTGTHEILTRAISELWDREIGHGN